MALLASATNETSIDESMRPVWNIGAQTRREFGCRQVSGDRQVAEIFERRVNEAAGQHPMAQWFKRWPDGSGQAVTVLDGNVSLLTEIWPATQFPPLLLRSAWDDPGMQVLCDAFIDWQSPYLLQLQSLSRAARGTLEQAAMHQAMVLETCHHLIPEWNDRSHLKAALVEAEIRRSAAPLYQEEDSSLQPFFNE